MYEIHNSVTLVQNQNILHFKYILCVQLTKVFMCTNFRWNAPQLQSLINLFIYSVHFILKAALIVQIITVYFLSSIFRKSSLDILLDEEGASDGDVEVDDDALTFLGTITSWVLALPPLKFNISSSQFRYNVFPNSVHHKWCTS